MKDIKQKLITLFKSGYCTPRISKIAKHLKEPSTTIHYNIKKLEKENAIKAYKAVFDYRKIDASFCAYVLISISASEYGNPERIGKELVKLSEVESVDVCTGNWELIIKVRTKDQDEYYNLIKNFISREGIKKIITITSLKQMKTEFVEI